MDSLIDALDQGLWCEMNPAEIEGLMEYQIMRQHQQIDETTIKYLIQTDPDADPVAAICGGVLKKKDPIKGVGTAELKVGPDGAVLAINLDGDCVAKK